MGPIAGCEPREWIIDDAYDLVAGPHPGKERIRVVEYSAYEALEGSNQRWKSMHSDAQEERTNAIRERDRWKEEYENLCKFANQFEQQRDEARAARKSEFEENMANIAHAAELYTQLNKALALVSGYERAAKIASETIASERARSQKLVEALKRVAGYWSDGRAKIAADALAEYESAAIPVKSEHADNCRIHRMDGNCTCGLHEKGTKDPRQESGE